MDHKGRLQRLQESLQRNKLDSLLVSHLPNVRYLCGFTGSAGLLVVTQDKSIFFTDGRYTAQARAEVQGARIVIARQASMGAAASWLTTKTKRGSKRHAVGVEGEHLTVGAASRLAAELGSRFRVRESPGLVEQMRIIKDAEEIALLQGAAWLGASLFEVALRSIRPGVKETDVAAEMEYAARKTGAEAMSFETIIASGERSALPHGRASEALIASEGFVVCDFGVILAGHCSDMTRTVYVGRPGDEARGFYEAVRDAQQSAVEAVRPGATLGEVDGAARKHLKKNWLGKYFTHSTGHGVGLEIHEAPRVAAGQNEELRAGMVITIEPGAYIPGKWGVRIEDMVVVTEQGHEVLTPTSKELIAL